MVVLQYDVYLINLDPTIGSEIQKSRPCVIISPNEMNQFISTIIIAPMTSKSKSYPTRVPITFQKKNLSCKSDNSLRGMASQKEYVM
jgi:mRNA interferase MazF